VFFPCFRWVGGAVCAPRYSLLMPERLRRLEWLFERNPIYFVTANTQHRAKILALPAVHKALQASPNSVLTMAHGSALMS
jgi:hypothetical protein